MAQITVQLYTMLGNKLVKDKISTEASNVAEALQSVERRFGREFRKEIYNSDGSIRDHYIVSLNGYPVDRESPKRAKVLDNDVLFIHPAVAGG